MKLVVKPPSKITTSTGKPCQRGAVPCWTVRLLIGSPAVSPKEKQALITPENVATRMPFLKLNSLMTARFWTSDISFSLVMPAMPETAIPARQTPTPNRITMPEFVPRTFETNSPLNSGGIRVPNAAQNPSATAMPSEMPR